MTEEEPLEFSVGLSMALQSDKLEREKKKEPKKHKICPRCGHEGSGLHKKWVLNEQGVRYYPYYWYAHNIKIKGKYRTKWCYIVKAVALSMLEKGSPFSPLEQPSLVPLKS